MDKLLSIIIPAYNCEAYIERCVDSILLINDVDYEVIIVDDGSTDSTGIVADLLGERSSNIRVFHISNSGAAKARYYGTEQSHATYVTFVDSDDYVIAAEYSELLKTAISKDADIITSGMRIAHSGKFSDEYDNFDEGMYEKNQIGELMQTCLYDVAERKSGFICSCCNKIFRREIILNEFKDIDVRLKAWEDIQYLFKAIYAADKVYISKKIYYVYDQRDDSTTHFLRISDLLFSYNTLIDVFEGIIPNFEQQMRWTFHIVVYSTYVEMVNTYSLWDWRKSDFCKELRSLISTDFFRNSFLIVKEEGFIRNRHMRLGIPIVCRSVVGGWLFERFYSFLRVNKGD